ncbi:MAG TPA: 23S rRNA (adenine(2030)-N(6))-methyltransferase RlmJ [Steroidobacteraceae bacterium]|jgi:23S rRNA (adenine2030-N6)-methyltransferase|nr:23S rRNA (adenine(2030)-N(6))-methyltransferase RlmJ [Steroidobacteraceae bacterium]
MNYRHIFHAGNFADVHKHVILLALIDRLTRKPKPLLLLDTHAGRGMYDLRSPEATRGDEAGGGVRRVVDASTVSNPDVKRFVDLLAPALLQQQYPGSPLLAAHTLRADDRLICVESQLEEAHELQNSLRERRNTTVIHGDGYAALKTYLPPKEARGLVLIDPPYESDREFNAITRALLAATKRWATGVYAMWYPIKASGESRRFKEELRGSGIKKILQLELFVHPSDSRVGLNGSGMLIVNAPWKLDEDMRAAQAELYGLLADRTADEPVAEWLVGE